MKLHKVIILAGAGLLIAGASVFYYKNLRGIWPAILPPTGNPITDEFTPFKLPTGFSMSIYAKDLKSPRVLAYDPNGNIIVSEMSGGKVSALLDTNGDSKANKTETVISGLNSPHGIAFKCMPEKKCKIYIAETDKVVEYDYDSTTMKALRGRKIVDLPTDGGHISRTLLFRPYPNENDLLIAVGSSCNVCDESDNRRAKILNYNTATGKLADFAVGLRNSVFMTIHPVTGTIWATEMGRDLLGDDTPPDEINIISGPSASSRQNSTVPNFGWPNCYGKNIHDADFDRKTYIRNPCMEPFETSSHIDLPAHSAPLGLAFIPEEGWPEDAWHNLLVAYHGSWNRSTPTGYKIVMLKLDAQGKVMGEPEDFITGWLTANNDAIGRPADILVQPGGTMYISDDKAGVIYLVRHTK